MGVYLEGIDGNGVHELIPWWAKGEEGVKS